VVCGISGFAPFHGGSRLMTDDAIGATVVCPAAATSDLPRRRPIPQREEKAMHQANLNQTAATGGARFGLLPWEKLIGRAGANHSSPPRQPLGPDARRRIFAQYQKGESIETLAGRFRRPRADIARLVKTMRAERIAELPLDFIPHRQFPRILRAKAEQTVLGRPPAGEAAPLVEPPKGVPAYLAALYEIPLLTRTQEAHLFRKMNYLKYKAARLRKLLNPQRPNQALMEKIEDCHREAVATRNQIVRANLRLVVSIAKRCLGGHDAFFELVSDGNMSLLRAVEKFDFARGYAFGTYAAWAIVNGFTRATLTDYRRRERFRTNHGETVVSAVDGHPAGEAREADQAHRPAQVAAILESLDRREREIIVRRFGLRRGSQPLTLAEISSELGVTKERIRQLESRALDKLRRRAMAANIECPV
jgi:RNA polymerase sigma factor (sigma-70 family)